MHEPAIIEASHRTAHVEREQHRLVARFHVLERRVKRFVQCVHHGRHRRPLERTLVAVALGVDFLRHKDRQRVDARALERRLVAQLADDQTLGVAEWSQQTEARHLAEVADHRRHRHAFEQGFPHNDFIEPLRWDGFARQVELVDELHDFARAGSALGLLEGFDELRQCADRAILGDTVFTANLALHFAFTQRIRAGQQPAEHRFVLGRRSLWVSEAEQVAVRPTIALLILHRLVREIIGTAVNIPVANGVAQTTAPTAHGIHVFGEVEQVRANAADLVQVRKRVRLRLASPCVTASARAKMAGSFFGARPASLISTMRFTARTPSALMQRTIASWFCFTRSRSVM
jgi:hypothetical protein